MTSTALQIIHNERPEPDCTSMHSDPLKESEKNSSKVEMCPMRTTNYNTHKDLQKIECDY
jgi:hypothetical protein